MWQFSTVVCLGWHWLSYMTIEHIVSLIVTRKLNELGGCKTMFLIFCETKGNDLFPTPSVWIKSTVTFRLVYLLSAKSMPLDNWTCSLISCYLVIDRMLVIVSRSHLFTCPLAFHSDNSFSHDNFCCEQTKTYTIESLKWVSLVNKFTIRFKSKPLNLSIQ